MAEPVEWDGRHVLTWAWAAVMRLSRYQLPRIAPCNGSIIYRGKTQRNGSDDRRVDPALATGHCWSLSLDQRFLCIFIEITNGGHPESRIPWLANPGRVSPRLARTASRIVRRTGLWVRPFFPNVARIPRPQTRHDRRKRNLITEGRTSLLEHVESRSPKRSRLFAGVGVLTCLDWFFSNVIEKTAQSSFFPTMPHS